MRLAMAFVLGLGGALAWRDSTLAKSRVGIFFFFLLPVARDVQGAAGQPQKWTWGPRGSHSRLVGDSEESGAQRALGSQDLRLGSVQK